MSKVILTFLIVFSVFFFGITAFRSLTGKEKWVLTKLILYSMMCSVLTVVTLFIFVKTF